MLILLGRPADLRAGSGTPAVSSGTTMGFSLGQIRFKAFTNGGQGDLYTGVADVGTGANRVEVNFSNGASTPGSASGDCAGAWNIGALDAPRANAFTFSWDAWNDRLVATVVTDNIDCTLTFANFSQRLAQLSFDGNTTQAQAMLGKVNYLNILVDQRYATNPITIAASEVRLDAIHELGAFPGTAGTRSSWIVTGYDFGAGGGFTVSGSLLLGGSFGTCNENCKVDLTFGSLQYDFGDLPDSPYPTLPANDGARHVIAGGAPYLGALRPDGEDGGWPSLAADGDNLQLTDDEDGVERVDGKAGAGGWTNGAVADGQGGAVQVKISGARACLGAFLDFDNNGSFADAGEVAQLLDIDGVDIGQPIAVGPATTYYFNVPAGTFGGAVHPIHARFRVTSPDAAGNCAGSPAYALTGLAPNGEVEDYKWTFAPTAVALSELGARPEGASPAAFAVLAGLVAAALVTARRPRTRRRSV
jgi:hypothetical protein